VLIAESIYDSADEEQTEVNSLIWTAGNSYIVKLPTGGNIAQPGCFRTLIWARYAPQLVNVESYVENSTKSKVIRMWDHTDEVLLTQAADADLFGYKLSSNAS